MEENLRTNPVKSADLLLAKLIEHQPELFKATVPGGGTGAQVGDFIAALRDRLIEMYRVTPR